MTTLIKSENLAVQTRVNVSPVLAGGIKPLFNLSDIAEGSLPQNHMFIRQDTSVRGDAQTVQIQRQVDSDNGLLNPKALRAVTNVTADTAQKEYAISGEVTSSVGANGNIAGVVGTATRLGGTKPIFGGSFQAIDNTVYAAPTDVVSALAAEINIIGVGLDHPTAGDGVGNRVVLDVLGLSGSGASEIGCGVRIRADNGTLGSLRYGLEVSDAQAFGANAIGTGIRVKTKGAYGVRLSGANTIAQLFSDGASANGAIFAGTYTNAAIRINSGEFLALDTTGAIKLRYNSSTDKIEFFNGAALRATIDMGAGGSGLDMN